MSPTLPSVAASSPPEVIAKTLREHGAVIVTGFLSQEVLSRFNAELDPLLAAVSPERSFINPAVDFFFGKQTRHLSAVAGQSRVFAHEILPHPIYRAVCDDILLPSCASYVLNIAHVMDRGPGAEQQLFHRDQDVWPHVPRPHPEIQLASIIALEDFSAANGATRIVPGSHLWPAERQATPEEVAVAEMQEGSAVIYLGSAIHAGGANTTTDRRRRGMHVSFAAGWLRTEENQYLSVPLDRVREMPRHSQELLGYSAHDAIAVGGGYLGTVDLVSPIDLLEQGKL